VDHALFTILPDVTTPLVMMTPAEDNINTIKKNMEAVIDTS
jgi:hypothetical protein